MAGYTTDIGGLGADGYLRFQKEAVYNTGITTSMTDLKIKPDTLIKRVVQRIQPENNIASRLKEDPQAGREVNSGEIVIDQDPAVMGQLFQQVLGDASSSGSAEAGYTHTWLCPVTGERISTSMTLQQALGEHEADQFNGVTATGFTLSSDNEGNQEMRLPVVAKSHTDSVARVSSWSFSALNPYHFGLTTITIAPLVPIAFDATAQLVDSYEFTYEHGYDSERWKLGDVTIEQPAFNAKPNAMLKVTIDADRNFIDWARNLNTFSVTLTTTHGTLAGSATGYYTTIIEIPKARISQETEIANSMERLKMDLEFDCNFGGTTTGSGAVEVPFELRHLDATATHA